MWRAEFRLPEPAMPADLTLDGVPGGIGAGGGGGDGGTHNRMGGGGGAAAAGGGVDTAAAVMSARLQPASGRSSVGYWLSRLAPAAAAASGAAVADVVVPALRDVMGAIAEMTPHRPDLAAEMAAAVDLPLVEVRVRTRSQQQRVARCLTMLTSTCACVFLCLFARALPWVAPLPARVGSCRCERFTCAGVWVDVRGFQLDVYARLWVFNTPTNVAQASIFRGSHGAASAGRLVAYLGGRVSALEAHARAEGTPAQLRALVDGVESAGGAPGAWAPPLARALAWVHWKMDGIRVDAANFQLGALAPYAAAPRREPAPVPRGCWCAWGLSHLGCLLCCWSLWVPCAKV